VKGEDGGDHPIVKAEGSEYDCGHPQLRDGGEDTKMEDRDCSGTVKAESESSDGEL
jgi:hypothetical protein